MLFCEVIMKNNIFASGVLILVLLQISGVTHAGKDTFPDAVPVEEYFFAAARIGDIVLLNEFVQAGLPIDYANSKGYTALILSAYNGQASTVEWLIEQGANPCAEDKRGNSALMGAIFKGELSIAKRLISADCNANHQNKAGQTPLMFASLFEQTELINALLERGADPTVSPF